MNKLRLLPDLFGQVWLTAAVAAEYRLALPAWAVVQAVVEPAPALVPTRLGAGERSAIGLALAHPGCLLIIDDEQPKQLAKALGIACIGTLGILSLAKEAGLIPLLRPAVEEVRAAGMWLSDAVAERVCRAAGE